MTTSSTTHGGTHRRPPESFKGAHTEDRTKQATGTGRRKGTQQNTAGDTQQPRNTQQAGGAEDKQREGRKGGREERGTRMDSRLGERWRRGTKRRHGSRQGAGREQTDRKKEIYKYLRERREKKRR